MIFFRGNFSRLPFNTIYIANYSKRGSGIRTVSGLWDSIEKKSKIVYQHGGGGRIDTRATPCSSKDDKRNGEKTQKK